MTELEQIDLLLRLNWAWEQLDLDNGTPNKVRWDTIDRLLERRLEVVKTRWK